MPNPASNPALDTLYQAHSGAGYLLQGFRLLSHPKLRLFVLVPLVINLSLFGAAFYWLLSQLDIWVQASQGYLPDWLDWLSFLLWPLLVVTMLLIGVFGFTTVTNLIAAPFNGLLAERAEQLLTGKTIDSQMSLLTEIPRVLKREWLKIRFYLPRALGCLILSLVPGVGQLLGPIAWFGLNAWMMGLQYADYPFDNHRIDFPTMRRNLAGRRGSVFSFGALYLGMAMLPLLNLILIPVAVCGATAMWVHEFKAEDLTG